MSWFKRKPKNRRSGTEHVLDVKLRSDQVRVSRLRMASVAMSLLFVTIFGFYLVWRGGEWLVNRMVYENRTYAIQNIDVETDGVIAPDQLRRWAGVKIGANLLALDLARVKRDLEMVSQIRSVAVERILPGTLRLRVSEREPVAQIYQAKVTRAGEYDLATLNLDEDGCLISLLDPRQRAVPAADTNDFLPIISGVSQTLLAAGHQLDSPQVKSALRLITAFDHSAMAGLVDLKRVDVAAPEVLQVTTGQGTEVTFGLQDIDKQLRRWREVYDLGHRLNREISTLDLSIPNNIPAKWTETGAAPVPVKHKPKTSQRNRRKNV